MFLLPTPFHPATPSYSAPSTHRPDCGPSRPREPLTPEEVAARRESAQAAHDVFVESTVNEAERDQRRYRQIMDMMRP